MLSLIGLFYFFGSTCLAEFEKPPILYSASFIGSSSMEGPSYKVEKNANNDGYMNLYKINSKYGNYEVRGTYFLIKRITEISAIDFLVRKYPSSEVAGNAALSTAKNIATAPIRGAEKLYDTVTNTKKLKKTAASIPGGVYNVFKSAANSVGAVAEFAYDTGASVFKSDANSKSKSTSSQFAYAGEQIEKYTLDFIGYNKSIRELSKELQIDPYTDNQQLRSELRRVSTIKSAVGVGSRFVPALYAIPGIGDANKYLGYAEKTAMYDDPDEIEKLNKKMLAMIEKDNEGLDIKSLSENTSYSPPMRHELIVSLQKLKSLKQIRSLIEVSSKVNSREMAQFYIQAVGKLAELHQTSMVFTGIIPDIIIPAAYTKDETLVIAMPVDYIVWTKEVSEVFNFLSDEVIKAGRSKQASIIISGGISRIAKNNLVSLGVRKISTGVKFD